MANITTIGGPAAKLPRNNQESWLLTAGSEEAHGWRRNSTLAGKFKDKRRRIVRHRPNSPIDDNLPRPASGPHNTAKMVAAKKHITIVKKHKKRFNRHQSDRYKCVDPSWRKPKGIDNRVRRRFSGQASMPKIGYGSNKKTRHLTPSGHKVFLVQNPKDVELLLMHNRTYAAEIGHAVSSGKRIDIIAKAKALGVKVTNPKGRLTTES
ncbi:60S ribosomal protein L32 [Paracoccidioides brasiliensis Pb18]|uniref:60S ribosomal protein L32 n=1 Tax=Paracoccidioides brasiliensis (strain Pb18) TaxID=502780 RepID=C1FZ57_PARBD|nr:60S ribosomal protein L32 [Paracoccidioides brasiliensis Pb18]EEH44794.2 60S ribosomal protein L32 [Paracoccidioides brasiliensis Pb18]